MTITNTLETAKRLEKIGFPHDQAQGLSEIFEQTAHAAQPDLSELVTKEFLRAELNAIESRQESRFDKGLRVQMLWFFTMLVGLLGATIAILKLFP